MKKLLILEGKSDALAFISKPFEVDEILSLNPTAAAELKTAGFNFTDTLTKYPDQLHKESARHQQESVVEFNTRLKELGYNELTINRVSTLIFYLIAGASFIYHVTQGYDEYYWYEGKNLQSSASQIDLISALLRRNIVALRLNRDFAKRSRLHKFILTLYNEKLILRIADRKKVLMMDSGRPTSMSFMKALQKLDPGFIYLRPKQPGKNIFATLKYIKRSLKGFKTIEKVANSDQVIDYFYFGEVIRSQNENLIFNGLTKDEFRQLIYAELGEFIKDTISISEAFVKTGAELVAKLNPSIITLDAITDAFMESACKHLKESGGKVIMFNHASNTPQKDKLAKSITNQWASQGIIYSPYATHNALRNPSLAKLVKEIYGEQAEKTICPLVHGRKIEKFPQQKFTIVFAGNYLPIRDHIPWLAETPDEFARSILILADAVSKIPQAELIIKLKKRKKECNHEAIEKLMPKYNNVKIRSSTSFKDDLAKSDLIVANLSTTIDEALESWTPVMLYSSAYRYQHLTGMSEIPDSGKRAAVYTPPKDIELSKFISGIIVAHQDKPLERYEIAPYVWDENCDDMEKFAEKVLKS